MYMEYDSTQLTKYATELNPVVESRAAEKTEQFPEGILAKLEAKATLLSQKSTRSREKFRRITVDN